MSPEMGTAAEFLTYDKKILTGMAIYKLNYFIILLVH